MRILQARILEWVAHPFSRGSSQPRNHTGVSCIAGRFFTSWITREAPKMQYFGMILKMTEWSQFIFRQTIQYHSNPRLCPTTNAEEAEIEQLYEHLQHLLELTLKNLTLYNILFLIGVWNAKGGSEIPRVNRQVWPWSTKWSRAKANRALQREHTGHSKHPRPTTKEMTLHMDITTWSMLKAEWLYFL